MDILDSLEKISNILLPIILFIFGILIFTKQKNIENRIIRESSFKIKMAEEFFKYSKELNEKLNLYVVYFYQNTFEKNKDQKEIIFSKMKELIWTENWIQFNKMMLEKYIFCFKSNKENIENLLKNIDKIFELINNILHSSNLNNYKKELTEKEYQEIKNTVDNKLIEIKEILSIFNKSYINIYENLIK